jgi:hypothetical protein
MSRISLGILFVLGVTCLVPETADAQILPWRRRRVNNCCCYAPPVSGCCGAVGYAGPMVAGCCGCDSGYGAGGVVGPAYGPGGYAPAGYTGAPGVYPGGYSSGYGPYGGAQPLPQPGANANIGGGIQGSAGTTGGANANAGAGATGNAGTGTNTKPPNPPK